VTNTLERIYRKPELPAVTGLQSGAIDKLIRKGEFPHPIPLNDAHNLVGWLESDLVEWQQRFIAARRQQGAADRARRERETAVRLEDPRLDDSTSARARGALGSKARSEAMRRRAEAARRLEKDV
jgi:predicted DNA-binding transcriptional regulator AlpA